jgi:hypothetical protein
MGENKTILIDMNGEVVHRWENPNITNIWHAEPLSNATILAIVNIRGIPGPSLAEIDKDNAIRWTFHDANHTSAHHDLERLDNGNTLILYNRKVNEPAISPLPILDDYILEINPQGEVVWEWHTIGHFDEFGFNEEQKRYISQVAGDWCHTNSISPIPANVYHDDRFKPGNIIVSQRNTSIIFVIDKATGSIVWKIGPDDNLTIGQHDVKMLPPSLPGAGMILAFDNGGAAGYPVQYRFYSRVVEINPVRQRIERAYNEVLNGRPSSMFFSPYISGAQRLPNGNTLIVEGSSGRIFEITSVGEIVWEYINPFFNYSRSQLADSNSVYRAWRVEYGWWPQ